MWIVATIVTSVLSTLSVLTNWYGNYYFYQRRYQQRIKDKDIYQPI